MRARGGVDSGVGIDPTFSDDLEPIDGHHSEVCESYEKPHPILFFCNACKCVFCGRCWDRQIPHKKKKQTLGALPHEKTELGLAQTIQAVFSGPTEDAIFEQLHADDLKTAWFGIERLEDTADTLLLRDFGRYDTLFRGLHPRLSRSTHPSHSDRSPGTCYPSLVSFVGQTGAGKSTLVKLLIKLNASENSNNVLSSPIAGIAGRDLPTSADIHLYADPQTIASNSPILYADCEGLDGGEREPIAAAIRRASESSVTPRVEASKNLSTCFEREISWANSNTKRTREFAVAHLYPRILFAFSDVVVFVHRNPRAIEGVLERLISWAAAVETSSNQPVLPCAILVLNVCENDIDSSLWDIDTATHTLLDSLAETVDKNVSFSLYSELWRARGKQISSVNDLILCYYSSFRVIRVPSDGRLKLIHDQASKLYSEIKKGTHMVQERKVQIRMRLNAFDFQTFFRHALNHFCVHIDQPFDFAQASFSDSRLSTSFSRNILAVAVSMMKLSSKPNAAAIFEKLSPFIASCIMLDAVRHKIIGTADRIFPKYVSQLDATLTEFCDKYWPCEYAQKDLDTQKFHANWSNQYLFELYTENKVTLSCANVKICHGTRGHQLKNGRYFAPGNYTSSFSVEKDRRAILNGVYFRLHHLLVLLSRSQAAHETQNHAATRIHQENMLKPFFSNSEEKGSTGFQYTKFCISCLFEPARYTLVCGHSFYTECIKAYGLCKTQTLVEFHGCPIHFDLYTPRQSRSIYLRPEHAGMRILSLDDGGVHSVVQVEVLKLIEKEFQGRLPLQCFFDLVVGEGTGGVLALGLASRRWTAHDCERNILMLLDQSFAVKAYRKLPGFSLRQRRYGSWKYHSKPAEECLRELFTAGQRLVDHASQELHQDLGTHLAVHSCSAAGFPVVFTNYPSKTAHSDSKLWEAARATMSTKALFKPFVHEKHGPLSIDSAKGSSNLLSAAIQEFDASLGTAYPPLLDAVVALGGSKRQGHTDPFDYDEEKRAWKEYLEQRAAHSSGLFHARFDVQMTPLPAPDDISCVDEIQHHVRLHVRPEDVQLTAARLFASLFYVEPTHSIIEDPEGGITIPTQLLCRLPDDTSEIHEIGKMLKVGKFRCSCFVFQETGRPAQEFRIPPHIIDSELIVNLRFRLPKFKVYLADNQSIVYGAIRYENGAVCPISGFPKRLVHESSPKQGGSRNSQIEDSISGQLLPWKAPDLQNIPPSQALFLEDKSGRQKEFSRFTPYQRLGGSQPHLEMQELDAEQRPHELPATNSSVTSVSRGSVISQRVEPDEVAEMRQRIEQLETQLAQQAKQWDRMLGEASESQLRHSDTVKYVGHRPQSETTASTSSSRSGKANLF